MYARSLLVIGLLWLVSEPSAQTYRVPRNSLFDFLIGQPGEVQNIHLPKEEVLLDIPMDYGKPWTSALLRNRKGVYLTINETGRVYRADRVEGDGVRFSRVDSTHLSGYNSFSFEFSHRDTIYSLGGYGFWRVNGFLRYFEEGREWSIVPLDREIPFHNRMAYYDSAKASVFYIQLPYLEESTGTPHDDYVACRLELPERGNRVLGKVQPSAGIQPGRFLFGSPSLGGFVVDDFRSIRLLEMASNRVWKLRSKALRDWVFGNSKNTSTILFESRGILYKYDRLADLLDSRPLSKADFEPTSEPVYVAADGGNRRTGLAEAALGMLALALIGTGVWLYIRGRKPPNPQPDERPAIGTETEDRQRQPVDHKEGFDHLEEQLIDLVSRLNLEGRPCTVEQLNHVLGVSRKSVEIQKKMRRDTLLRINRTFREATGMPMDLVASRRSEEDKRFYHYFIPPEAMEAYRRMRRGRT